MWVIQRQQSNEEANKKDSSSLPEGSELSQFIEIEPDR